MSHNHHFEDHCRPEPHHEQHHTSISINFNHCDFGNQAVYRHYENVRPHAPHHSLPPVVIVLGHERHCAPPPPPIYDMGRCESRPYGRENPLVIDGCFDYGRPVARTLPMAVEYVRPQPRNADFFVANPNTGYDADDFIDPREVSAGPAAVIEQPQLRQIQQSDGAQIQSQREAQQEAQQEAIYNQQWGPEGSAGYDARDNAPRESEGPIQAPVLRLEGSVEDSRAVEAKRSEAELNQQWGSEGSAGYDPADNAPRDSVGPFEAKPVSGEQPAASAQDSAENSTEAVRDYAADKPQTYSEYTASMARYIAEHVPMSPVDNF